MKKNEERAYAQANGLNVVTKTDGASVLVGFDNFAAVEAAAKHLNAKAKNIDEHLSVWPLSNMSGLVLDYNSPAVGVALLVADAFSIEAFLNTPEKVLEKLNA